MRELEIYKTSVTGTIPSELGAMDLLWHLDLENNNLTGSVPVELRSNGVLDHLLLRGNQLTGEMPQELCSINRTWFDCSDLLCGCECACSA